MQISLPASNQFQIGQKQIETQTSFSVYVTPLPLDIQEQDLRFLFSLCGPIKDVFIVRKSTSKFYRYGFVHFHSYEAQQKAKKFYNGRMLGLKSLQVTDIIQKTSIPKKDYEDFRNSDKETMYEENGNQYQSMPKKRVHKNERISTDSKHDINSRENYRNYRNKRSSESYLKQRSNKNYHYRRDRYRGQNQNSRNELEFSYIEPEIGQTKENFLEDKKKEMKNSDSFEY